MRPREVLFGRPLIGNGANGVLPGSNGQPGGILMGNGGNGADGLPGQNGGNGGAGGLFGATAATAGPADRHGHTRAR